RSRRSGDRQRRVLRRRQQTHAAVCRVFRAEHDADERARIRARENGNGGVDARRRIHGRAGARAAETESARARHRDQTVTLTAEKTTSVRPPAWFIASTGVLAVTILVLAV